MKPPKRPVQLLSVIEVAGLLGCSRRKVYDLICAGRLRTVDIGLGRAQTRIREDDLQAYIEANTRKAAG